MVIFHFANSKNVEGHLRGRGTWLDAAVFDGWNAREPWESDGWMHPVEPSDIAYAWRNH
jgi:hypothetical protein